MKIILSDLIYEIRKNKNTKKMLILSHFFKTGKGEYGEGDKFLGITVSKIRKIVKKYNKLSLLYIKKLLKSIYHEERLTALFILIDQFEKGSEQKRKKIFNFYLKNIKYINNWDLVDLSAYKIIGKYLLDKNISLLYFLARSKNMWKRRIAIISTFAFIKIKKHKPTFEIGKILIKDKNDLIQKSLGWMLREVGKRCGESILETFLKKYGKKMGRTAIRYAIERFEEKKRKNILQTTK